MRILGPIAFALSLLGAAHARAGGFELAEQAASASGAGSASTARDDDASAAWFNPAALADDGDAHTMAPSQGS